MGLDQFSERKITSRFVGFHSTSTPGDGAQIEPLVPGDWRADVVMVTNSDVIDHTVIFSANNNASSHLGTVTVPAGAGWGTVPIVDALAALRPTGYHYWLIEANDTLYCDFGEAIGAPGFVVISVEGGSF